MLGERRPQRQPRGAIDGSCATAAVMLALVAIDQPTIRIDGCDSSPSQSRRTAVAQCRVRIESAAMADDGAFEPELAGIPDQTQLKGGIDQSTSNAPTAIMESTAFATTSAGQGITFTEGEGGGGPG
jgi:hypothetical protein